MKVTTSDLRTQVSTGMVLSPGGVPGDFVSQGHTDGVSLFDGWTRRLILRTPVVKGSSFEDGLFWGPSPSLSVMVRRLLDRSTGGGASVARLRHRRVYRQLIHLFREPVLVPGPPQKRRLDHERPA